VRDCLWLVKNGVPVDLAFGLDAETRTAWAILFAEMEGQRFNWDRFEFKDPKD